MTVQEFIARSALDPCSTCGARSVTYERDPQNNGLFVRCPNCGAKKQQVWPDAPAYLKQNARVNRPARPAGKGLYEIWNQWGRCAMCSATQAELLWLGIGLDSHHVDPYRSDGDAGAIVPMCKPCHAIATARQGELRRWLNRLSEVYGGESVPAGGEKLSLARVPPDPVRAARQAPVGVLESVSDDDADA